MRSSDTAPGPLLRLTAIGAAIACVAVVAAAALELGTTHWGVALVALPLLVAVAVAAWIAYPRLRVPAVATVGLMLAAIATGGLVAAADGARWASALHVAAAGGALAFALVKTGLTKKLDALAV